MTDVAAFRARLGGFAFGGDYNPEQWDRGVWDEDVELMKRPGSTSSRSGCSPGRRWSPSPVGSPSVGWTRPGPAARQRHQRRPRHADRVAAGVAVARASRRSCR